MMATTRNNRLSRIQPILLLLASIWTLNLSAQEHISSAPQLSRNPLLTEAYQLLESGDSDGALEHFQEVLSEDQQDLSALLGQAMTYAELQRYDEAFASYDAIVQTHPRHAFAWNGRGLAAFNMEDFDTALSSFQQATAEQPINGFFYETLAWTQMCRGDFSQAAISAKTATLMYNRKNESSVYPQLIAYFAYLETGDLQNAQVALKYAQHNKPLNQWPSPVIDYLSDSIDAAELISYVTDSAQETEAHTYIGLKLRANHQNEAAKRHFNWVARHGDTRVFEYTLARALNIQNSVALLAP
ncbi:tetratricopeptide repeat protein [Coraliomargarita algicola]|uniref:Tetratricopeptide repeat protein n=1 Tax=Coraliomargarita algicola TaxID=3092156 RepID=A0ABZ0RH62_9BACT|nr:tetratricopeptide repeat protein [Coraliomargarita sp. J2-16]WPJ95486.1 tetratricopeptide repeat protein [Coraliomargarita sp. J2-16]